jgi:prephenate dehydrogenase
MKLTVVGLGLIGGSMAIDLRKSRFATEIIGVDNRPEHAADALKLGIIDRIADVESGIKEADLILLALPVDQIITLLPGVLDLISPSSTVVDVGSAKRQIVASIADHPLRGNFVATHPMAGTENSGPGAAVAGLFAGKLTIVCDHEQSRPQHLALVEKMYQSLGMSTAYMSSDEQDHTTAFVSHLPHAAAFALANAVLAKEDGSIIFDLASGGFQSTVRLAKSSPEMWAPIFRQNRDYVIEAVTTYIHHLKEFKEALKNDEQDHLVNLICEANKIRTVLSGENTSMTKNEETIVKLYTKK